MPQSATGLPVDIYRGAGEPPAGSLRVSLSPIFILPPRVGEPRGVKGLSQSSSDWKGEDVLFTMW